MSSLINVDILTEIANRQGITFERILEHLQAQVIGGINRKYEFKLNTKANVPIWSFPNPLQTYTPKLDVSLMRVDVSVSFSGTAPKMYIRTYANNTTYDEIVLGGDQFTTKVSRSFDKQMAYGERYNIFFDQDCTLEYLKITEIPNNS